MTEDALIGRALRVLDDAAAELRRNSLWLAKNDEPLHHVPQCSEAEARRRAAVGSDIVRRIDLLEMSSLPRELRVTVEIARHSAAIWSREADWFWLVCDPLGLGFFSLFTPTAYCGGSVLNLIHNLLREFPFREPGDFDRYCGLVADYARLLDQFTERTQGQAERGIRMPKVQCERAVELFTALRITAPEHLNLAEPRIAALGSVDTHRVDHAVRELVLPAYDRLLAGLDGGYRDAAPDVVGMGQYPGGAEIYAELVKLHTTLPVTPTEVHANGLARLDGLRLHKLQLARDAGYEDFAAYEGALNADRAWRADTAAEVTAIFQRSIDRIAPALQSQFDVLPRAGVRAAPLPPEVSGSMTFGYYAQPSASDDRGTYFFNAANLTQRGLQNVAALTYHELMPGHHLHIATQLESQGLSEVREKTLVNAFNEGWAEYAATLAGEMGMYAGPEERYGRLMMDSFLTCRLVVDTGMNALGWELGRARAYLREHSGMSDAEIDSETIRYSCDIPAQSLAYKLGDDYLVALREEMRLRLGERFDIRDFHAAVLRGGSRPWSLVASDVREAGPSEARS